MVPRAFLVNPAYGLLGFDRSIDRFAFSRQLLFMIAELLMPPAELFPEFVFFSFVRRFEDIVTMVKARTAIRVKAHPDVFVANMESPTRVH